jgi:hypothetical protein
MAQASTIKVVIGDSANPPPMMERRSHVRCGECNAILDFAVGDVQTSYTVEPPPQMVDATYAWLTWLGGTSAPARAHSTKPTRTYTFCIKCPQCEGTVDVRFLLPDWIRRRLVQAHMSQA